MRNYSHKGIEEKWSKKWAEGSAHLTDVTNSKNKYYCLDMFPYPSGEGLHVGHWRGYVLSDVIARYQVLLGNNVLHPMGFDSFGLPAENAAIKNKKHPTLFTQDAIVRFTKQINEMGAMFDWSKQVTTSNPDYYRWTQWLFLLFFKHGLAEKRRSLVNWCPNDQTVLANEQVVNGCCDRCGCKVSKKELEQWYVKTTHYADELLSGLDDLNWPDRVKTLQRNWIGKSNGAHLSFGTDAGDVKVFTTRADTLYGVSALVLSPEHPLAEQLTLDNDAYKKYLSEVASKTNIDREQQDITEKTGLFTGSYAVHPITKEKIPVWLADYVLMNYGTGAIMCVPAHDERDFLFAKTHNLLITQVIQGEENNPLPYFGVGKLINSGEFNDMDSTAAQDGITKAAGGELATTFRLRDWLVSRQRYWGAPIPIVYDPEGQPHPVKDEHLPLELPTDVDFLPGGESPIARSKEYIERAEKLYGQGWRFETDTLDTFVDSSWYYLRYLTPKDTEKAFDLDLVNKWLPVDLYIGGIEHATLHLLYARFVTRFLADHGYIDKNITEPFKQLFNIGMITLHGAKMSKSKGNVVSPDPLVEHYGVDALRGYELFVGPMDEDAEWNPRGINGIHRFLIRLNTTAHLVASGKLDGQTDLNEYFRKTTQMMNEFKLNTYISEAMKALTDIEKNGTTKEAFIQFVTTLSPIFPYLSEEINELLGQNESVFKQSWPKYNPVATKQMMKVLINQKYHQMLEVRGDESQEEIISTLKSIPELSVKLSNITAVHYRAGIVVNIITS